MNVIPSFIHSGGLPAVLCSFVVHTQAGKIGLLFIVWISER